MVSSPGCFVSRTAGTRASARRYKDKRGKGCTGQSLFYYCQNGPGGYIKKTLSLTFCFVDGLVFALCHGKNVSDNELRNAEKERAYPATFEAVLRAKETLDPRLQARRASQTSRVITAVDSYAFLRLRVSHIDGTAFGAGKRNFGFCRLVKVVPVSSACCQLVADYSFVRQCTNELRIW